MPALTRRGGRLPLLGKTLLARSWPPQPSARPQPPARTVAWRAPPGPLRRAAPGARTFSAPAPLPSVAPSRLAPDWPAAPALPTPYPPASSLKSLSSSGRVPICGPDSAGGLAEALPRAGAACAPFSLLARPARSGPGPSAHVWGPQAGARWLGTLPGPTLDIVGSRVASFTLLWGFLFME